MRRRCVLALFGASAASWLTGCAEHPARMRRIGVLMPLGEDDSQGQARISTFRERLKERGWIEGHNLRIDVRWGPGDAARYRQLAAELVTLAPDIVLAGGGLVVAALQQATRR